MPLIQWDDKLSVNVEEIDKQHQKLVQVINELQEAMQNRKGNEVLGKIIEEMVGYARTHFKTEEVYFDKFGYPEADSHKKEHAEFMDKVSDFKKDFDAGRIGLSVEVMNFLSDWLKNHIMGSDKNYSAFFNEKGLK